jgi:D-galactose 1-dehydrogenase
VSRELVAAATPHHQLKDVPYYQTIEAMLAGFPAVEAVAICTPPQARYEVARRALEHGCHVLLEKPPGATLNEVHALIHLAQRQKVALFATWHSREAAGVEPAREWLAAQWVRAVRVEWKEDVRVWHPGQSWIWKAGGLGVFDPGINALSILTHILPGTLVLKEAELAVPENCETPIAAKLELTNEHHAIVEMELDFLHAGSPSWTICVTANAGELLLENGGA